MSDRHFVKRTRFTAIAIWDGSKWIEDYKWDYSNCHDFGSAEAAQAFAHKCIFADMALPVHLSGFCRFGSFKIAA